MKIVLAFGTYDHLHPGHLYFLKKAAKHGKELHVIVALDRTVKKVKGTSPRWDETRRLKEISAIPEVDFAYLVSDDNYYDC